MPHLRPTFPALARRRLGPGHAQANRAGRIHRHLHRHGRQENGPGKIELKWSRIEHRFNGTWREGEDDRFGDLSIHVVDKELRGGLTTSDKSKINPATPRLAELAWTRAMPAVAATPSVIGTEKPPASASPRTGYTLTGRVLNEPGGKGVYGATVSLLQPPGRPQIAADGRGTARGELVTATTAPDGTYSFSDLPPGNYMVGLGTNTLFQPAGVWSEGAYPSVVDHDVRADDLCLKLPQSVSGTVRDADTNEPVANAEIRFTPTELTTIKTGHVTNIRLLIFTDVQGRYRLYLRSPKVDLYCDGTPQL